jgi:ParB/Sulfiredoxin domain
MKMKVHPVADLFPMLEGEELRELAEDIKTNGLRDPIVMTSKGILADGRNRLSACKFAKVNPRFKKLPANYSEIQIMNYIISVNIHRRHLTASDRVRLWPSIKPYLEAEAQKRQDEGRVAGGKNRTKRPASPSNEGKAKNKDGEINRQGAKILNVGHATIAKADKVFEENPKLGAQIGSGKGQVSVDKAYKKLQAKAAKKKAMSDDEREEAIFQKYNKEITNAAAKLAMIWGSIDAIKVTKERSNYFNMLAESLRKYADGFERYAKGGRSNPNQKKPTDDRVVH